MSRELAHVLIEARKRAGLTQQQVADAVGVSRPAVGQWESGSKEPSTGNLMKASEVLQIFWQDALKGKLAEDNRPPEMRESRFIIEQMMDRPLPKSISEVDQPDAHRTPTPNVRLAPEAPIEALAAQIYLPLDVPVLGVSMGGDGHDFQFNGETVDYVRRPLGIAKAKRAYATYVVGESMVPAFREGAVLFVNPDKPPSIGDDVVIELIPARDGEPGPGYIKRLKKRTASKIIVEQFNPPEDLEFDLIEVKAMHRVVPWNELLGI